MRKLVLVLAALAMVAAAIIITLAAVPELPTWTPDQNATLHSLALGSLPPLTPNPSNALTAQPDPERSNAAIVLGSRFFVDPRFGKDGQVSCMTCHQPDRFFTDGRTLAQGAGVITRHSMTLVGSSYSPWQTWDGKADSQWSQALGPLENQGEMAGTRMQTAAVIAEFYRPEYEALFGPLPALTDTVRFPVNATPLGDQTQRAAWAKMAPEDQTAINRVAANFGKALEAYERTILPVPSRFDDYVAALAAGDEGLQKQAMTGDELAGLALFIGKAHCINCHNGPLLTNFEFHNTGVPPLPGMPLDYGRTEGIQRVQTDPFNCLGAYSDASPDACSQLRFIKLQGDTLPGAFKTPTLRNVAETAPYMHAGQFATLADVLQHYNGGGFSVVGHSELTPLHLTATELKQLEAFLRTLSTK
ncbi:MAG: cytochrome-c peroxidase [Anaerolineales bacterium]|nr:cytochrome-c peroxidase [Anaerolineales bacterium]